MGKGKSKVLFILHLPPPVHGSSIVGKSIKKSELINESFNCDFINISTSKAINEIGKGSFAKVIIYLQIIKQLIAKLLTNRYDLCYMAISSKGVAFYKDLLVVAIVKLSGTRIVYHLHNKGINTRQDNLVNNLLYRFAFDSVSVILLSKLLYKDIQKYVLPDQIYICPNGIERANLERKTEIVKENIEILFLSNMIKSKGVFILLDACKILSKKNIDFSCSFVGGRADVDKSKFKSKVKNNNLTNYVRYLGPRYGKEKEKCFNKADAFAFPTFYHFECFPLVLLEAMSFGLPIVSTNEGGIPDIVEDGKTGFICKTKDAKDLAEKLEILIKNPELRWKMGSAGRRKFEQNFTLEHFEIRLKKILNSILKE